MKVFGVAAVLSVVLTGCVASQSGQVYQRNQVQHAQTVQYGTVSSVQFVQVEGTKSGLGGAAGAVAGGFLGSTIGGGDGRTVATVAGALGGAVAGHMIEGKATGYDGIEITVNLDSGSIISVVQEADVIFPVGARVRVLSSTTGTVRIQY